MKKLLVSILALLFALTACTAEGTTIEETAEIPTEVSLDPAPTVTDEPTAEPTATDVPTITPEPEPTETAEPTATATVEPQSEPPQEEAPSDYQGSLPEGYELPEGAVIVFTKTGGFAGLNNAWVFYEDGRVTLNGIDQEQLAPERIDKLVNDLDALGFFGTNHSTKPGEFCCDFFDYTLAAQTADRQNFVSFSDGNLNLPTNLLEALVLMREITDEAQVR